MQQRLGFRRLAVGVLVVAGGLSPLAAAQTGKVAYPKAKTVDQTDTFHGTSVHDPYRWMEDIDSADTKAWVEAENKITFGYLDQIPERSKIKERLTALWNYEKFSAPGRENGKFFYSYNSGLQNQSVLYVTSTLDQQGKVLMDPNTLRADGTAALAGMAISEDAKYMAYGIAEAGSDWNTWKLREVETGKDLADELKWVKFSGAAWMKDGSGFFYSRYDEPKPGQELAAVNYYPKVYFHKVNTAQAQDALVYERPDQKEWGLGVGVTEDGKYLVMSVSQGTDPKNRLFVRDLTTTPLGAKPTETDGKVRAVEGKIKEAVTAMDAGGDKAAIGKQIDGLRAERQKLLASQNNASFGFVELLNEFDASYEYVGNDGPMMYISTNLKAPRTKLIAIDLRKPARDNWKELIPQSPETLQSVGMVGDFFFANYLKDAKTQVKQFDLTGKLVREVKFPGIGTGGGFGGKRTDSDTYYSFTSYNVPPSIFHYDIKTGESKLWKQPKVPGFNPDDYTVEQKFYTSKDGTKVPMFITYKKGVTPNGNNPTLLYGYGGFNISLTPGFSPVTVQWLEMGGVYAVANLRGGGEYGEDWHQAGTKTNKQNVFNDFISAAEWLVANKYTTPKKLAIQGGSNGGLLIGACMTQRPDLFGACLPAVGVMDMLRFHKFTIGWAWQSDYGDVDKDADVFKAVNAYSPYHNAKPGTCYPPTMITTADHDDRVFPAHSFKFAAAIQAAQSCDSPVLIRIETRAGHGAGKPTSKRIDEAADTFAFLVKSLGMKMN